MGAEFSDYRRIKKRVRRSLKYGPRPPNKLNLPLSDMVVDYFNKFSPFDYMAPETSTEISRLGFADPCTLVVAMVYLDRLRMKDKEFFESSNPTDLYLPALVLASKFLHDSDTTDRACNSDWAEAGHISDSHLNNLEWDFVKKLDWDVMARNDECERVLSGIERWVAADFVGKFGVVTYNELSSLSSGVAHQWYLAALQDLLAYVGLSTLVYALSILSLFSVPNAMQTISSPSAQNESCCSVPSTSSVLLPGQPTVSFPPESVLSVDDSARPHLPSSLDSGNLESNSFSAIGPLVRNPSSPPTNGIVQDYDPWISLIRLAHDDTGLLCGNPHRITSDRVRLTWHYNFTSPYLGVYIIS